MKRLRIAILDEELPATANSGKRIRTLSLITRLSDRHDVTYVARPNASRKETEAARERLAAAGIRTVVLGKAPPRKSGVSFYARLGANLLSPLPYSVATHMSRQVDRFVKYHHGRNSFDLWHCEWTPFANHFRNVCGEPLVVMAHNIESQIWRRYYEVERNKAKRAYIFQQWKKFAKFEKWAFGRATRTVTVSFEDAKLAREQFGAEALDVVENGVDTVSFSPSGGRRNPHELLFVGSLDWRPNLDGISCFLDDIFSKLLRQHPETRLSIVGRNPPRWLIEKAANYDQVQLHADVPDVRPFFRQAGLLVVPLRVGGGSRLKILEAAASELPIVSTRVGAEGLSLAPTEHYVCAPHWDDLEDAIIGSIQNYDRALLAARKARCVAVERYDWNTLAEKLDQIWLGCCAA